MSFEVGPDFDRPAPELIDRFARAEVTTLGHLTDFGFPRGLAPLSRSVRFVGPAVTVKVPHLDGTAMHRAMDFVRPGDVVVIDHSGDLERSCFGGVLAAVAQHKGVVGVVSDGSVNDFEEIVEMGLPVYSRGVTPKTTRLLGIEGAINVPVCVGGVVVMPGDIVFADPDGVAVVEQRRAASVVEALLARQERSAQKDNVGQVRAGADLSELSGARALFDEDRDGGGDV